MKKILFTLIILTAASHALKAQTYVSLADTIWGCRYFSTNTITGQPVEVGYKTGVGSLIWPSSATTEVNYYVRIPAGHCKADIFYTPRLARQLATQVTITNRYNGKVVYSGLLSASAATSTSEVRTQFFADMNFTSDAWYQIKLTVKDGNINNAPARISKFIFNHESTDRVVAPTVFMAPSAHNSTWGTTQLYAPQGNCYDWIYGEFLFPDEYAYPNRYLMCLGGSGYYSGIQVTGTGLKNTALFSAWDNGDTDVNPNLPEYLRSGAVDHSEGVKIDRFGNEGTGIQSMMNPAHWIRGHWVQWLMNARPETTEVILKAKDGSDSIITYPNTILTAWYKMADENQWYYISSIRQSGTTHIFGNAGEYSFLENYNDFGGDIFCRAYMKNRFYRSAGSGKWYNRNYMTASHYNYNDGARECRFDYGHGATSLYDNCFYIEHGGFGLSNDSSMYVAIPSNTECVDTIDLDSKQARIDLAFRNKNYTQTSQDVDALINQGGTKLLDYAKNLIDNKGKIGSYGEQDIANIISAYNNGSPSTLSDLGNAIKQTAQDCNQIRFANVTQRSYIATGHAYVFDNCNGYGLLYGALEEGKPVIKVGEIDRMSPYANWIITTSDRHGTICIYNIGLGLYIDTQSADLLSDKPTIIRALGRSGKGFYIGNTSSECLVASEDGILTTGRFSNAGAQFFLHDNLSYNPKTSLAAQVAEQSENVNKFNDYKTLVPGILNTPKGVVGSWTNESELELLETLYDDGNITEDNAEAFITLIDNAQKLSLPDNKIGTYKIVSASEENSATPILSIDEDTYLYHKAPTNKAEQIWLINPKNGGYEISSQGRSINALSYNTAASVTTTEEGNGPAFFFNDNKSGIFSISDVQNGPMIINGMTSPISTIGSDKTGGEWYLMPVDTVRVTLNSAGINSLYLDFDVTLPEGLSAYSLSGFNSSGPQLTPIADTIYAHTPVILKGTSYGNYNLSILPKQTISSEPTIMQGTLLKKTGLPRKTFYTVAVKSGQPTLALALNNSVNANQCYILKETMDSLGLTESQYDIDFDNLTAINDAKVKSDDGNADDKAPVNAYDLQGRKANDNTKGIIIKQGKKEYSK